MPMTAVSLPRALRSVALGVLGSAAVLVVAGCTTTPTDDASHVAASVIPETTAATAVADARVAHYQGALFRGGFPDVIPQSTLFALADGVCRQSAAGTPDDAILEQLWPVGAYGAGLSGGDLTPDTATQLLLDAARSEFC